MHHTLHDDDVLPMSPMSDYYQTLNLHDGAIALAPLQDSHWTAVLDLVGYPELLDGPVFATMGSRLSNMDKVSEILKAPRKDVGVVKALEVLKAADIPCALCERRDTVMDNVQIQAIGALETYITETLGELTLPTPPCPVCRRYHIASTTESEIR
ncbi:MAG: CoA transferase [Porticoccaceae bacterium]|nr:CoA transferase [Porticoccaceae bacterium]